MAVSIGASALGGDWEGYSIDNPWFWGEWLGYSIPFAWVTLEALPQYARARKRLKLGLCDALVCHRFLLWSAFGIVELAATIVIPLMYAEFEDEGVFSVWSDVALGGFESLGALLVWLVFFPPAFYRRWVAGSAPGNASPQGDPSDR